MNLTWSARRQLLYYAVGLVMATILLFVLWQTFLTRAPSCFDNTQNGDEAGVDCGGSCAKLCSNEAPAPNVLWARSFETAPETYTAVAYVENRTQGAGAHAVSYSFQLFDEQNELVAERDGVADLPPVAKIPIIEPNINVGTRNVARTIFRFSTTPVWERVSADALPQVHITGQSLSADGTHLSATIVNDGFTDARNIVVTGVIFNADGLARAASVSAIDRIAAKSSEPVIFTWGSAVPDVARAEITVLPSF